MSDENEVVDSIEDEEVEPTEDDLEEEESPVEDEDEVVE